MFSLPSYNHPLKDKKTSNCIPAGKLQSMGKLVDICNLKLPAGLNPSEGHILNLLHG